ncbi:glycosyltransferase family 2 protein [Mucilaginibacter mali]|uniref:Glycosyltransferase family 2 protein n=1 Tax=Mucilaginibacter mali TaxID=2740462 RepID=A0A7D4UMJ8_9SPHI|nr:glycosyltransferase family 2 protein [Mucilaginibacter mali]QKJ28300.1 glycosyltransferase family 2 protein [Mucilaginibacter mali]
MKKISIITVNFNQPGVTRELLLSIQQVNTYKDIEIIVVDNGSTTGKVTELIPQFTDVKFIRSEANLGFAGGNNIGIAAATGDYFFLVNTDTEFTPDLVQKLVDVLDQHPEVGMVSPRIQFFPDTGMTQYAGSTQINFITGRNKMIGKFQRNGDDFNSVIGPTAYIHGAAVMVKREVIDKAGPMHESYFLYYEEVDWCEHVKKAGYKLWVRGDAVIYHKESISVGKKSWLKEYFMTRNRILFTRRNASPVVVFLFYIYFLLIVAPRNILGYIKSGNTEFIKYLFKAIWWNFTHKKDSHDLGVTLK